MPIFDISDLNAALGREGRLLGLDLGSKTVGLALSDVTRTIATPMKTLTRGKFAPLAEELYEIIGEHEVKGLVIGLPVSMDGTEGPRCQATRQFAANMLEKWEMAVAFWDERLSTAAVERVLINEADMTRKRRAAVIDKAAAAYILQGALDAMGRP